MKILNSLKYIPFGKAITRRIFLKRGTYGVVAAGLGKGYYNTTPGHMDLVKKRVRIPGLAWGFKGFKIALLSDFHASPIANEDLFERAAALVMKKKPDMIALTGDFVTGSTKFLTGSVGEFESKYLNRLIDSLAGLKAPMGIYGTLGNHDFWSGEEAMKSIMDNFTKRLGVVWLRNQNVRLERRRGALDILGVDDYWEDSCSLSKAYKGLDKDTAKVLLSHNPDINDEVFPQMRVDLILSGHTHGGQVALPFIGQPIVPSKFGQKYRQGLVRDGDRQTYITRGVGHLLAPIRFNCPPEATLITLD